ncbi:MAG: peptide chain release factor N(5)-glutamine methyltransferase [Hyphomicrobiaceae bacterium]
MRDPSRSAPPAVKTAADAVRRLVETFRGAGIDTPELDARILVAEALGISRTALMARPEHELSPSDIASIAGYERRRQQREPVSRILGRREFRALSLEIGATTLDPRPDTEIIVDAIVALAKETAEPNLRVLDLGTGSGAILIAVLMELPGATGVGTDIDAAALQIAQRNAEQAGVAQRAEFQRADWLTGVTGTFDIVVSNPPYISSADISALEPEVSRFDPRLALDGGPDGLAAYRAILANAGRGVAPGGWIVLEIGNGQAAEVMALYRHNGFGNDENPRVWVDLGGRARCVAARSRR